jgi:hypothetical protein
MKRKELKEYIKNEIIEILSEAPIDEASAEETEETTQAIEKQIDAIEKLEDAKKKAGLAEVEDEDDSVDDDEIDKKASKSAKKFKSTVEDDELKKVKKDIEKELEAYRAAPKDEKSEYIPKLKKLQLRRNELIKIIGDREEKEIEKQIGKTL